MSRLRKAKRPILTGLGAGALTLFCWLIPGDAKVGNFSIGVYARVLSYLTGIASFGYASLKSWELDEHAHHLQKLDEIDLITAEEAHGTQRAAELRTVEVQTTRLHLSENQDAYEQLHQLDRAAEDAEIERRQKQLAQIQVAQQAFQSGAPVVAHLPEQNIQATSLPSGDVLRVLIGKDPAGQPQYWVPSQQANGFLSVLGASGSGKTETLKAIACEINAYGIPCFVVDFHGDIDVPFHEVVLSRSPSDSLGVNPLELDSLDPREGGPETQTHSVLALLQAAVPAIGHRQSRVIKAAIETAYLANGIYPNKPETWSRPAPVFGDVLRILERFEMDCRTQEPKPDTQKANLIASAIDAAGKVFEHPVFSKPQWLSPQEILKRSTRLNLKFLGGEVETQFVIADTILRKLGRTMRGLGHIPVQPQSDKERYRCFAVIDEAKRVTMGRDRDDPKAVCNEAATEWRKWGWGMILASQIEQHFSDEVKAQVACRLILKPFTVQEAAANAGDIGLPTQALMGLQGRGDGYLKIGANAQPVRVQVIPVHDRALPSTPAATPAFSQPTATPEPEPEQVIEVDSVEEWQASDKPIADSSLVQRFNSLYQQEAAPEPEPVQPPEEASSIPKRELVAALSRLCDLLHGKVDGQTFALLVKANPENALWYGLRALNLSVTATSQKVFALGVGGSGFYKAQSYYQYLENKFGAIRANG